MMISGGRCTGGRHSESSENLAPEAGELFVASQSWARQWDVDDAFDGTWTPSHHDHAVTQINGLIDVMRDEQHRRSEIRPDLKEQILEFHLGECIKRAERLVEKQHLRFGRQRPADRNALGHATGERPGKHAFVACKADALEQGICNRALPASRTFEAKGYVVTRREPRHETGLLKDDTHTVALTIGLDIDMSPVITVEIPYDPQERTFSASTRTYDADDFTFAGLKADPVQNRRTGSERLVDVMYREHSLPLLSEV
jgi:hypothetical protein